MTYVPVVEQNLTSPQELFDAVVSGSALDHASSGWAESPWAFRGHGAEFPLLPSALRPGTRLLGSQGGRWQKVPENATYEQRAEFELTTLRVFFQECDRHGLRVPGDTEHLRERLYTIVSTLRDQQQAWPPLELLPLMAVAQHHGIPTRLLDWTRDASVALYFAALGASKIVFEALSDLLPGADRRIALLTNGWESRFEGRFLELWAINLREAAGAAIPERADDTAHVRIVVAPRAGNENLYAQRGIFTIPAESERQAWDQRSGTPIPLEKMVRDWEPLYERSPFLVRLRLPLHFGPDLLARSLRDGTSAARLFPGFDGAARALKEREYTRSVYEDPPW